MTNNATIDIAMLQAQNVALQAQVTELHEELAEMAEMAEQTLNDNVMMGKVFDADDRLATAVAQLKIETEVCRVTRIRLDGFVHEKNEVIRMAKSYKRRAERAERELAALRKQMLPAA